ncbi:MAG: MrpF/PhaF family protein [Acidobacteriaceae bacterium]
MNHWIVTANVVGASLIPCAWMSLRGTPERRLVGVEMTGIIVTLLLVLLCLGYGRLVLFDLPLTLALMTFGAGVVFARFLEKHL